MKRSGMHTALEDGEDIILTCALWKRLDVVDRR